MRHGGVSKQQAHLEAWQENGRKKCLARDMKTALPSSFVRATSAQQECTKMISSRLCCVFEHHRAQTTKTSNSDATCACENTAESASPNSKSESARAEPLSIAWNAILHLDTKYVSSHFFHSQLTQTITVQQREALITKK